MTKAFTLIELIITSVIIITLLVISLPSLKGYDTSVNFQNKRTEIEFLLNETAILARNPQSDNSTLSSKYYCASYSASGSTFKLSDNRDNLIKQVVLSGSQSVSLKSPAGENSVCCYTGSNCRFGTGGSLLTNSLSSFFEITDSNAESNRTFSFCLQEKPFRIKTKAGNGCS